MRQNPNASFYALEVLVAPGGAREWMVYALNNLPDIQQAMEQCLEDVYLTLWYGRTARLRTFINGIEQTPFINLLPFVTYHIDGYPPVGFNAQDEPTGLSRGQIKNDKVLTKILWQYGSNEEQANAPAIQHEVDWTRIHPPVLSGNLLQPGDRTRDWGESILGYGINDVEQGYFRGEGDEEQDTVPWEDEWMDAEEEAGE